VIEMGRNIIELLEERFCKVYGKCAWMAISIYLKYEGVRLKEPPSDVEGLLEVVSRLMGDRETAERALKIALEPLQAQ